MDKLKKEQVEQLLQTVRDVLENEGELIIMVAGKGHAISAVQGNPKDLGFLVAKAMKDEKAMYQIFSKAVMALEGFEKFMGGTDLKEVLKCENCDNKETCDIYGNIPDKKDCQENDAIPMGQGGDA